MKIYENGIYRELTEEELLAMKTAQEEAERDYWINTSYDDQVNSEIRKQYSESQEFAILRQQSIKPEEYQAYYDYCEECKTYVKAQRAKYIG